MVKFAKDIKLGHIILAYCVSIGYSHCGISSGGAILKKMTFCILEWRGAHTAKNIDYVDKKLCSVVQMH